MTIEIDLPPLPEPNGSYTNPYDGDDLENYARANVANAVEQWKNSVDRAFDDIRELRHGVAAKDAEIERLRAEIQVAWSAVVSKAGWEWRKQAKQAEARAERLAEALRKLSADLRTLAGGETPDGDGVPVNVILWAEKRLAALRDHDQEKNNGR